MIGNWMDKNSITQISRVYPNLKSFAISSENGPPPDNFPEVGRAIWTHLKKLRSLTLDVYADGPNDYFPAFDSCITGCSKAYFRRICHLLEADKLWRKCGTRMKIQESEMKAERKYPSILDLKSKQKCLIIIDRGTSFDLGGTKIAKLNYI